MSGTGKINDFVPIGTSLVGEVTLLGQVTGKNNKDEQIERLQEQLDIVTEQRNDIHIDKQVLQKQLNEANRIIKKLYKESGNPIGIDYLEKWGVK